MTSRERVLAIIHREPVDRLPVDIWYTGEIQQMLFAHFGVDDEPSLWRALGVDKIAWIPLIHDPSAAGQAAEQTPSITNAAVERTMWGTPLKSQQAGDAAYMEFGDAPLKEFGTVDALDDYPYWPDPEHYDYAAMTRAAGAAHDDFVTLGPWVSFFEIYCQMRGLEQALMDVAMDPDYVQAVLDRIEDCQTRMLRKFYDAHKDVVDLAFVSDDLGSQTGLLMSPKMWETFLKPRLARWCDMMHDYGLKVLYHSDGAVEPLIGGLIDAGIDILNPIQHVCTGMGREGLKAKYGDRLVFHGGVENQKVLPFGSADDVREETRACMKILGGSRQGYIVCSCHNIQPGTPLENVLAMVETVHAEGAV